MFLLERNFSFHRNDRRKKQYQCQWNKQKFVLVVIFFFFFSLVVFFDENWPFRVKIDFRCLFTTILVDGVNVHNFAL